jgi:O-antigen/teichoic acid export membrane protein
MSKEVKRVVKNSFFQTIGAFGMTGLNFILLFGYAHILGPENFGSLVTSQAQVLVWALLVDLGLSNTLIGALTAAEGGKTQLSRQGFRARDLILRVLAFRLIGALLGAVAVFVMARLHAGNNAAQFWQDMAFLPHLFALALQQTALAYATYRHHQGFSVVANLLGVALTVVLALALAWQGASIPWLLLAQSWGGFVAGFVIFGYFLLIQQKRKSAGATRRVEKKKGGAWGKEAWRALAADAGPYAITFAVFVLWSRLDQIAASRLLGFEQGGQYALAVRLVAIPLLVATSISYAVFPDLQRVGRDAPERLAVILGALLKAIYRYGILLAALVLLGLALVMGPLFPKYEQALHLLPYFVPGVWAYWAQAFLVNGLFGSRRYRAAVKAHLFAILIYLPLLLLLPRWLGLQGVVWSFNIFCLSMFFFCYRAVRAEGILPKNFSLFSTFTAEENLLWSQVGVRFFGSRKRDEA